MAAVTFKFREDLFKEWWLKYEVELGIEDVIIKFKSATSVLDIITALGEVANALKKTGAFAQRFIEDEAFRDELAEDADTWLDFGGIVGATIIETFDKKLIKMLFDMGAQQIETKE